MGNYATYPRDERASCRNLRGHYTLDRLGRYGFRGTVVCAVVGLWSIRVLLHHLGNQPICVCRHREWPLRWAALLSACALTSVVDWGLVFVLASISILPSAVEFERIGEYGKVVG